MDESILPEIKRLKDEYMIGSRNALMYLRERQRFSEITAEIKTALGDVSWEPTEREVENLYFLSVFMTGEVLNTNNFVADNVAAVVSFYSKLNQQQFVCEREYFEATMQLLPQTAIVDGSIVEIFETMYILPLASGNYITFKRANVDIDEGIIDTVRRGWTLSEQNYLFCHPDFEGSHQDIEDQVSYDDLERLGLYGFYDPIYFRLDRAKMLGEKRSQRRIAFNYIANHGYETVDDALDSVRNQIDIIDAEIEEDEIISALYQDNVLKIDIYERTYLAYIRETLISNRDFLERRINIFKYT